MSALAVWGVAAFLTFGAWAGIVLILPNVLKSRARYQLWGLRDEVVDAMFLYETLPDDRYTRELVTTIEHSIRHAEKLTLLDYVFMPKPPSEFIRRQREELAAAEARLRPEGAKRLRAFLERYERIIGSKVLFGSPSGWLALPLVSLGALGAIVVALAKRLVNTWRRLFGDRVSPPVSVSSYSAFRRSIIDPERVTFSERRRDHDDDEKPLASFA